MDEVAEFLFSVFLFLFPVVLLQFMSFDVYFRHKEDRLNRTLALVFFMMSVLQFGFYLVQTFPAGAARPATFWLKYFPAFVLFGFILVFIATLTGRLKTWRRWKYYTFCFAPSLLFLLHFIPDETFSFESGDLPASNIPLPGVGLMTSIMAPAFYTLGMCYYFLVSERKRLKQTDGSWIKWKQIDYILIGALFGGLWGTFGVFLNPYLYAAGSTIMYPEPSSYGMIIFAWACRQAIVKYEFLPSVERKYEILFRKAPVSVLLVNREGGIMDANPSACRLFGMTRGELLNADILRVMEAVNADASLSTVKGEYRVAREDGERIVLAESEKIVSNGERYRFILIRDITDQKKAEEQIRFLAYHDSLTGLDNRVLFREKLKESLESLGEDESGVAVAIMDLDRFKWINDNRGHHVGDQMLLHVAKILREAVPEAGSIARLGGDEFALFVKGDRLSVDRVCRRVIEGFRVPYFEQQEQLFVSASMGISFAPSDSMDPLFLMKQADMAMYEAKKRGKNQYCYFGEPESA